MASGDLIAQCWLEKVPVQKIDWSRTARFGIIGCIFVVSYSFLLNSGNLGIFLIGTQILREMKY